MATAQKAIQIARKYVLLRAGSMQSSAELCLGDAIACYDKGDFEHAKQRALKSIAYSVGILHPDYQKAA